MKKTKKEKQALYPIRYSIELGSFTKEDLEKSDSGGCDNLILLSVMGTPGECEGLSVMPLPVCGDPGESLSDDQVFMIIAPVLHGLSKSKTLQEPFRKLAEEFFAGVREEILIRRMKCTKS